MSFQSTFQSTLQELFPNQVILFIPFDSSWWILRNQKEISHDPTQIKAMISHLIKNWNPLSNQAPPGWVSLDKELKDSKHATEQQLSFLIKNFLLMWANQFKTGQKEEQRQWGEKLFEMTLVPPEQQESIKQFLQTRFGPQRQKKLDYPYFFGISTLGPLDPVNIW